MSIREDRDPQAGDNAPSSAEADGLVLGVNDLHAGYGEVPVLRGVSLRLWEGEAIGIVGHNGMGVSAYYLHFPHRKVFVEHHSGTPRRLGERLDQQAVFDLMIARAEHRAGYAGTQMRLAMPCLRPRQPLEF